MLGTRGSSEVTQTLSAFRSSHQKSTITSRSLHDQLVKSKTLTTSSYNPLSSNFTESQSTNSHFGHIQHSIVINNSTHTHSYFVFFSLEVLSDSRERHRVSIDSTHVESFQNGRSELTFSSSGKELKQFY
jgi:hypothetical protein